MKNLLSIQDELNSGSLTLPDLVEQYIETIEKKNGTVNALV